MSLRGVRRVSGVRAVGTGVLVLVAGVALAGCGSDSGSDAGSAGAKPELKVDGAFIPAPPTGDMASGFFTVTNSGGADELTSVTSDLAADVTLHTSTDGGAMVEKSSFKVPAQGTLDFARGGNHVMFEKMTHQPKEGEKVAVTLHFKKAGAVTVEVPVREATYNPTSSKKHHG
ncbi:copper chaperone PCu(A)C [Streptomyces sp. NPDC058001]|uniref:copper chaperone PCu(A)C n=1 Tax=Streptomyces sp. NPDC058001 TaxID=3346300 RepID=UPI0036E1CFE4